MSRAATVNPAATDLVAEVDALGRSLSLVRARRGTKLIANSCLIVKSGSGVACPP